MEDNTVIGAAKRAAGRVENATGALIGDTETQVRGKIRELGGAVQQRYGETTDAARELIGSQSLVALAAVGVAGIVAGLLLGRR